MQFLNEKGRAIVDCYIAAPETLQDLCTAAKNSAAARESLITLVWLMAGTIVMQRHTLAFDTAAPVVDPDTDYSNEWPDERLAELT